MTTLFLKLGALSLILLSCMTVVSETEEEFKRKKREWIIPASKLTENVDYTKQEFIAKITSDRHTENRPVEYSLKGPGADEKPYNIFVINPKNGFIRITDILDREYIAQYNLKGIAKYIDGSYAEQEVPLKIQVEDQNDNQPKFKFFKGSVNESSKIGTSVMQISAEDADEQGTINSKVAYSIVKQTPGGHGSMFSIDRETGKIYVKQHTLDRETHDSYTLVVQGVDMDGAANGYTGIGTVKIQVLDINDNAPTLEQDEYVGTVEEGVAGVVVMKIKALDKDLKNTDNWLARFEIIKGNEDELFSIETNPKTNEGIVKLIKAVDYDKVKELNLDVAVSNVAPFSSGAGDLEGTGPGVEVKPGKQPLAPGQTSVPIKITVNNLSKGPVFSDLVLSVTEDPKKINIPKIIGSLPARDRNTGKIIQNVRYAKAYDPGNWLAINEKTSEIKLIKIPDRESEFVVNGTYLAKIVCITEDMPSKTATGTIALKVEDSNDHCPKLTSAYEDVCSDTNVIHMTAFDEDIYPNQEPYKFVLIKEETRGQWEMVPVNGTTVSFLSKETLWPGVYQLTVEIFDMQGLACEDRQKLQMKVCTCQKGSVCVDAIRANRQDVSSVRVGAPALLFLALGLVLLMLVPLLLLSCQYRTENKHPQLPLDPKVQLITHHTEGLGEDKEVPLFSPPVMTDRTSHRLGSCGNIFSDTEGVETSSTFRKQNGISPEHHFSSLSSSAFRLEMQSIYEEVALSKDFLHGYFTQKASCMTGNPPHMDSLLIYSYEGQGSSAGSVSDSSLLEEDNDLEFLHDLGPKFMTLAEICSPPKPSPPPTKAEHIVKAVDSSIISKSSHTTNTVQVPKSPTPPPQQSRAVTNTTNNSVITETINKSVITETNNKPVITETNNKSDAFSTMNTSHTLLMQQQPMYYLVKHQVPNTMILAERPAQGMYIINGHTGAEGLILQGGNLAQGTLEQQGMYVINGDSMLQGGIVLESCPSPTSPGSFTVPTIVVKEQQSRQKLHHSAPTSPLLWETTVSSWLNHNGSSN